MEEKITLCGDDCLECPRYRAGTREELERLARLWYQIGWKDRVVPAEEMRCGGCSTHKSCTYGLVPCFRAYQVEKCSQCSEFPCGRIREMLKRSEESRNKCAQLCTPEEYAMLEKAFFAKEQNLMK